MIIRPIVVTSFKAVNAVSDLLNAFSGNMLKPNITAVTMLIRIATRAPGSHKQRLTMALVISKGTNMAMEHQRRYPSEKPKWDEAY
jgi:hypothetical protein